jgi:hypothetical protein
MKQYFPKSCTDLSYGRKDTLKYSTLSQEFKVLVETAIHLLHQLEGALHLLHLVKGALHLFDLLEAALYLHLLEGSLHLLLHLYTHGKAARQRVVTLYLNLHKKQQYEMMEEEIQDIANEGVKEHFKKIVLYKEVPIDPLIKSFFANMSRLIKKKTTFNYECMLEKAKKMCHHINLHGN